MENYKFYKDWNNQIFVLLGYFSGRPKLYSLNPTNGSPKRFYLSGSNVLCAYYSPVDSSQISQHIPANLSKIIDEEIAGTNYEISKMRRIYNPNFRT